MMHECWLPELEYFEDYQNSWEIYENALYDIFREDFVNDRPEFEGQSVKFRRVWKTGGVFSSDLSGL